MIIIRLMRIAIFISFSHPCEVTDSLTDVMSDIGVDMLPDMGITVMDIPAITLEFVVGVADAVDVLADVMTVVITGVVLVIDVKMLTNDSINGLIVVMTSLEFTLPSP